MGILRRKSIEVQVGSVRMGGKNPILVQSMTNTDTGDVDATVKQIVELVNAGSEMVRFTVKDENHAKAVSHIKKKLQDIGLNVPLVGDFHYNGHKLLTEYPDCAKALDKLRINPGNVGFGDKQDENFKMMVDAAIKANIPVRIGVNRGSLDAQLLKRLMDENQQLHESKRKSVEEITIEAMVNSALESAKWAQDYGLPKSKIVISAKVSNVPEMIEVYRRIAKRSDYALHLGLTEAGLGTKGIVASTAALSILLQEGIGDTIRVSITPPPGGSRTEEVKVAMHVLQQNGLRQFAPTVTSCPGCGRTNSSIFQEIAVEITKFLEEKTPEWKKKGYSGFESMKVAVMGCIVNGPGESRDANIGLSLPGTGEDPLSPVFIDGKVVGNLKGKDRISRFKQMIEEYVENTYSH